MNFSKVLSSIAIFLSLGLNISCASSSNSKILQSAPDNVVEAEKRIVKILIADESIAGYYFIHNNEKVYLDPQEREVGEKIANSVGKYIEISGTWDESDTRSGLHFFVWSLRVPSDEELAKLAVLTIPSTDSDIMTLMFKIANSYRAAEQAEKGKIDAGIASASGGEYKSYTELVLKKSTITKNKLEIIFEKLDGAGLIKPVENRDQYIDSMLLRIANSYGAADQNKKEQIDVVIASASLQKYKNYSEMVFSIDSISKNVVEIIIMTLERKNLL